MPSLRRGMGSANRRGASPLRKMQIAVLGRPSRQVADGPPEGEARGQTGKEKEGREVRLLLLLAIAATCAFGRTTERVLFSLI